MNRLADLLDKARACRVCIERPQGRPLPHEPRPVLQASPTARLLIAGQAPGTRAHFTGRPFTDASGDRLRAWLAMEPETFYDAARVAIVPMGLCFPGQDARGGDLPPRAECTGLWHGRLMARLTAVELVLAVGLHAQAWHLGDLRKATLTETVKAWRDGYERLSPPVIALPHPSWRNNGWIRRNPWFEHELLPVLRGEVQRLFG